MSDLNFLDLVVLKKIDADSTVEKFGSLINTSFFETANLLGTIKLKGYINIESSIGGASAVSLTDEGKKVLELASQKSKEPIGPLDNAILLTLASGARDLDAIQDTLNIRSSDLAYHINKLVEQGFMDFEVRSAKVHFLLTEAGFNATGGIRAATPHLAQKQALQKEEPIAPPWVNPEDVKAKEEKPKQDVAHILGHEPAAPTNETQEKPPAKQEDQMKNIKMQRMLSKLQYYLVEYAPYLLLIVALLSIFGGAILLSLTKFS
ncbi:MAG: hypothetical protein N3G80_00525 [Candidatus Micrarchaeota archaeon]|nr:hypothetical protein [Candidatus Micrarchaeota archaeon]